MTKFIVKSDFWELFPMAQIGVVLAKNVNNSGETNAEIKKMLATANDESEKFTEQAVFSENPAVSIWREAYQQFKTKKGARSSIENLLKRVSKGNEVRSINPLVDIYNSISLTYGLPAGGEDLDKFDGDMRLTKASGGEDFLGIGDNVSDLALAGEIAYLDDSGAVCRCWNWKDGQRTMLTERTKNAFLIVECVDPERVDVLCKATKKLADLAEEYFDCETSMTIINKENPEMKL